MLMYAYTPSWILSTPIQPMYVPYTDVRDVRSPVRQAWRSTRSTAYYVKVLHVRPTLDIVYEVYVAILGLRNASETVE